MAMTMDCSIGYYCLGTHLIFGRKFHAGYLVPEPVSVLLSLEANLFNI